MNRTSIWRRLYEWDPVRLYHGPGKILDRSTYRGCFMSLVLAILVFLFLWHIYDLLKWLDSLWGIEKTIEPGKQSWSRIWAVIIGGGCILTAIGQIILIPINRRRARESAEGQWYDRPNLTREELQSDEASHEQRDREQQ